MPDVGLRELGRQIQRLRESQGFSQTIFARKIGTTQSALSRIETGEQNISARLLSKISQALQRDVVGPSDGALNVEIVGGCRLRGMVVTKSSKNSAVGLLGASLLNRGRTRLEGVPRIEEVYRMIEVLKSIGVSVRWDGSAVELKPPAHLSLKGLDEATARRTRSSILLMGPLLHECSRFRLPHPGGCRLGSRTVHPHLLALAELGVEVKQSGDGYELKARRLNGGTVVLYESGDTVTENLLMAAARIPAVTTIKFASGNYQVQDLCFFLERLGVRIDGIGTTTLTVYGTKTIDRTVTYPISEDPIESMFFITAAILTRSSITVARCPIDFLELELLKLKTMGFRYHILRRYRGANGRTTLVDIKTFPSTLSALPEKIECRPYPGLNIDNLPFFAVIATQAKGETLIHDWVYEERAIYYKELDKLGARTLLADPHRFFIKGPTKLKAAEVICPPALRPAAIILIGMLAAEGTSVLRNIYSINRGYEDIVRRLKALGARITFLRSL